MRGNPSPDRWLEGAQMLGLLVLPYAKDASLVSITGFRGDAVDAIVWDAASGGRRVALHARDLVGLRWFSRVCRTDSDCTPTTYRVVSASRDSSRNTMPAHASNRDVWLYQIESTSAAAPTPSDWANACDGTRGSRADATPGLFLNGRWAPDGTWTAGGYTVSCPAGVLAKCVRSWGYKPWKTLVSANHGRVSLLPLHLACVRAARADYCGDGNSHTRNGTLVDIADRYGFNVREDIAGFRDESAFGTGGALWVDAPRWPTATPDSGRWRFATCARPMSRAPDAEPLLRVRSATYLGR
jgi:hypothetical protein